MKPVLPSVILYYRILVLLFIIVIICLALVPTVARRLMSGLTLTFLNVGFKVGDAGCCDRRKDPRPESICGNCSASCSLLRSVGCCVDELEINRMIRDAFLYCVSSTSLVLIIIFAVFCLMITLRI